MDLLEMLYELFLRQETKLLYIDSYQGYEYYITLLGSHPCAYIVLGEGEDLFDKSVDELEQLPAHGCANYVSTICLIG